MESGLEIARKDPLFLKSSIILKNMISTLGSGDNLPKMSVCYFVKSSLSNAYKSIIAYIQKGNYDYTLSDIELNR